MTIKLARLLAMALGLLAGYALPPGSPPARAAGCAVRLRILGRGYGQPDDLTLWKGHILFGDLDANVVAEMNGGRPHVLARDLAGPEGIVLRSAHQAFVVEQKRDRLDVVNLRTGRRRGLHSFPNNTGLEGIDGISSAGHGSLYVPDSPHGLVYRLDGQGRLTLLARGLGRPVAALTYAGGVAVADENAHAVWMLKGGKVRRLATLNVPDDLVVFRGHLLADTLKDGKLWEVLPKLRSLAAGFSKPQGLVTVNRNRVALADSTRNRIYALDNLQTCL